jgi:hypothetical protein
LLLERRGHHPPTQYPSPSLAPILCIASSGYDFSVDAADKIWTRRRVEEGLELAPLHGREKARDVAVEERQTRAAMIRTIGLDHHFFLQHGARRAPRW